MLDPDTALMVAFREGDTSAFDELFRRYHRKVLNLVARFLGPENPQIEDLSQEVFLRIWRSRDTYLPEARFSTWLWTITANLCINELRKKSHRETQSREALEMQLEDSRAREPASIFEGEERIRKVQQALRQLPARERVALLLSKFEGLCYEEIADVLGISMPAVKSLLFRARQRLRKKLSDYLQA